MVDVSAYAAGLRQAVPDAGAAWHELAGLAEAVVAEPALKRGLIDAAARRGAAREKRLATLLSGVSRTTSRLVELLLADRAIDVLPELRDAFARELQPDGFVRVHFESASPLELAEVQKLLRALKLDPAKALVTIDVEEALVGGVRATVDGRVVDATLDGRLHRVAEALAEGAV